MENLQKNRLYSLRTKRRLSLGKLSLELKNIGISASPSQLSYYEKGTRSPRDKEVWNKLANFFGVSPSYLLGYDTVGGVLEISSLVQSGKLSIDEIEDQEIREAVQKHIATSQKVIDEEARNRIEETYLRFITDLERLRTLKSDTLVAIRFIESIQNNLRHGTVKPYSYAWEMEKISSQLLDLLDRIDQRENELTED